MATDLPRDTTAQPVTHHDWFLDSSIAAQGGDCISLAQVGGKLTRFNNATIRVFCRHEQFGDTLVRAFRETSCHVGFVPCRDRTEAERLLRRSPCPSPNRPVALGYSTVPLPSRMSAPSAATVWSGDSAPGLVAQLSTLHADIISLLVNGRQTFCYLPERHLLHPTIHDPKRRIVGAGSIRARIVVIQSCHSPFAWSDFGEYLTLPTALLAGSVDAVITSTRVQWPLPGAVVASLQLGLRGSSAGEIVAALNELASNEGTDDEPFVLLGDPRTRCHVAETHEAEVDSPRLVRATDRAALLSEYSELARKLDDLVTCLAPRRGDLKQWAEHLVAPARIATASIPQTARDEFQPQASFEDRFRATFPSVALPSTSDRLRTLWREHNGYYYSLSGLVEARGTPVAAHATTAACPSCGSLLTQRRVLVALLHRSEERLQTMCPKCLVVRDAPVANIAERAPCDVAHRVVATEDRRIEVVIEYANATNRPQWCFARGWITDPNNVSADASPRTHEALMAHWTVVEETYRDGAAVGDCFVLDPGQRATWRWWATRNGGPSVFYLLHEAHVFINFEWQWLGSTLRARQIRSWTRAASR